RHRPVDGRLPRRRSRPRGAGRACRSRRRLPRLCHGVHLAELGAPVRRDRGGGLTTVMARRIAVIAGATRGIGFALTRALARAWGLGTLKSLPSALWPRFAAARGPDAINAAMDDYVAAVEAGTAAAQGWPDWVNLPSKVGQVAVTRAFARAYLDDPARRPGVLI